MTTHLTLPTNFNKDNKFDKNIFRKIVKKILESNVSHAHGSIFSRKKKIRQIQKRNIVEQNKQTKVKLINPPELPSAIFFRKNQNHKF